MIRCHKCSAVLNTCDCDWPEPKGNTMTDLSTETIRKAVELAEGFQLTNDGRYFSMPHGGYVPTVDGCQQQYLDALAAQLTRQVDATGTHFVGTAPMGSTVYLIINSVSESKVTQTHGKDRTMNTIQAIVEFNNKTGALNE